jgi:hypothetical protein
MAINKGLTGAMFSYTNKFSSSLYGEDQKNKSEQYYKMVIGMDNTQAMYNYSNKLSEGFYDEN